MNLEPIIQTEVSQKEKDKYCILTHVYGIQKMVLKILFPRQQWRNDNLLNKWCWNNWTSAWKKYINLEIDFTAFA